MLPPADLDRLAHTELKSLVVKQWEELAELRRLVATLRDEIARLKGGSGRPNIKPSGMDKATEPKPGPRGEGRPKGGGQTAKLPIHEDRTHKGEGATGLPDEARAVLRAGLSTAAWIRVDDPGARHKAANASARTSATRTSPGSAPPARSAAATSSNCCAPATAITSSMPTRSPTCANAPWPSM